MAARKIPLIIHNQLSTDFLQSMGKTGKYFVKQAIEAHQAQALQTVIDTLSTEIENLL